MYLKFKELILKNINSYGNKKTIFTLNKGLNCISGVNGKGKSTILDALCFCLYGKPFRKVKISELINRINKKGLFTQVTFEIKNDVYTITRELKPNKLTIHKNGKDLDLLSTKALNQDEIDTLLGIDITLFRQIISLAINYNKPYLALTVGEKRDIIETIFNVKIFGKMIKQIKNDNTGIKTEYKITKSTIQILKDNIITLNNQLKSYTEKKENFDEDKNKELNTINNKINNVQHKIKELTDKIKKEKTKITNKNTLQENSQQVGVINHTIKQLNNDLDFFKDNSKCPKCYSSISIEHKEQTIKKSKEKLIEYKKEYDELRTIINYQISIKDKTQQLKYKKETLKEYKEQKQYIEEQTFAIDLEELSEQIEEKKNEYKKVWNKLNTLGEDIKLNDIIIKMLGDEGIKTYFFAKLIPILNNKVNEFLDLFDIPINITFDEYMTETINSLKDKNISYMSFSEGEKKRIDIAILLSFIETTKMISNWGCNLIMFDELFDNSTDSNGLDKIFDAIKEMLYHDKELCVYIISHRELSIEFDGKYIVKKSGNFSTLSFENNF